MVFNWARIYLDLVEENRDKMNPMDYVKLSQSLSDVNKMVEQIKNRKNGNG